MCQLMPVRNSETKALPGNGVGSGVTVAAVTGLPKVRPASTDLATWITASVPGEHTSPPVQCTDSTKTFPVGSTTGATERTPPGIRMAFEKVTPPSMERVKNDVYPSFAKSTNVRYTVPSLGPPLVSTAILGNATLPPIPAVEVGKTVAPT